MMAMYVLGIKINKSTKIIILKLEKYMPRPISSYILICKFSEHRGLFYIELSKGSYDGILKISQGY